MSRRVAVTGLGLVTPVGHSVEESWTAIKAGKSGVAPITLYDATNHQIQIAAEVKNWDPTKYVSAKEVRRHDRYQIFIFAAAMQALEQAGWGELTEDQLYKTSTIIGSSVGGVESFYEQAFLVFETNDLRKISPFGIPRLMAQGGSDLVGIALQAHGPSHTPVSACATGADSIGQAFELIRSGRIDRAVAGCGEAPIIPIGIGAFDRIGAMSRMNDDPEHAVRPFDKDRTGLVFAEGAGVLALEELEIAKARGANILAELVAYATTSDGFHVTAPEPEGMGASKAIEFAMGVGEISADDIDYINAHGTATALNDPMETKAIKRVLGERAYSIPMSSTKSMTGHGMGMTAAIEAVFCVLAIQDQVAPPTMNYETPDPECDLDYVPNETRDLKIDCAMSNSFGFGGHNSSLIFKKV
jgi:beta-ketoacyl-acyl-carrier-protein synthase II